LDSAAVIQAAKARSFGALRKLTGLQKSAAPLIDGRKTADDGESSGFT